jgi:hypothetical protein
VTPSTVTREDFPNGACIVWDPWPLAKWSVFDCHGVHQGWRRELATAREFAAGLPGAPIEPEPPRPISRSPRVMPLPPTELDHHGHRPSAGERGERVSRPPAVHQAYMRAKSLTRRHHR